MIKMKKRIANHSNLYDVLKCFVILLLCSLFFTISSVSMLYYLFCNYSESL